ncbi:hypothetical protein ABTN00_20860, partial [Acinetobacter baumannii]
VTKERFGTRLSGFIGCGADRNVFDLKAAGAGAIDEALDPHRFCTLPSIAADRRQTVVAGLDEAVSGKRATGNVIAHDAV